jgi:hypothetical protein
MQKLTPPALGLLLAALVAASALGQAVQDSQSRQVVNRKYGFSLLGPKEWFVFEDADLPSFYSFRAEKMLPKGELPLGGAEIDLVASREQHAGEKDAMRKWALEAVARARGTNTQERPVPGPTAAAESTALWIAYDQLPLGTPGETLHMVLVTWQTRTTFFGAQLRYWKGDRSGSKHERAVLDLMRSFRSL